MIGFEGPLDGEAQVFGLLVCQLGQLHPQLVQMSSSDLLVQLGGGEESETGKSRTDLHQSPTPVWILSASLKVSAPTTRAET